MQSQDRKKILLIIGAGVAVLILLIIGVFLGLRGNKEERLDNPSGETISNPAGREAETFATQQGEIIFYGVKDLINAGVSSFMVQTYREQLRDYSQKNDNFITSASVYSDSIDLKDTDTETVRSFKVQLNESDDIYAELRYASILRVRLVLLDKSGKQLYDSGTVTYNQDTAEEFTGDGVPPEERQD